MDVLERRVLRKLEKGRKEGRLSEADIVASMTSSEQELFFKLIGIETEKDFEALEWDADFWLRPKQKIEIGSDAPYIAALIAGRGFGKTRTMTEWVRRYVKEHPGCRIGIASRTMADNRNTFIYGSSGIMEISPPEERPEFKQMQSMLVWPNGSTGLLLSSEVPDGARGPSFNAAVGDEFAAWKTTVDASGATLYSNLLAATRDGDNPQILLATTPKRTEVMKTLLKKAEDPKQRIRLITGSTYENTSLSGSYIQNIENQYGNSDLARQELGGEMLADAEGIIFSDDMLEMASDVDKVPSNLIKIIAVDPTVGGDVKNLDECGIMVIGATRESNHRKRKAYVLEDATITATPENWSAHIAKKAQQWGVVNIVAEANQGGDLIRSIIQSSDSSLKVHLVHATKGKIKRVEPVAVAMQQGRVFFSPKDDFLELKDQLTFYDPDLSGYSPDRMDAFAWGMTALLIDPPKTLRFGTFIATRATGNMPRRLAAGRSVRRYGNRSPRR